MQGFFSIVYSCNNVIDPHIRKEKDGDPHIRKEKDRIPLTGLTPSCFSLPIHISGRRRMGYN